MVCLSLTLIVHLPKCEPMNCLQYKGFWWIYHRMGSLVHLSCLSDNPGEMLVSTPIIEKSILFNIVKSMDDTVTKMMSILCFLGQ